MTTATATTPPARTADQRMRALQLANDIRCRRAKLKTDLKSGRRSVVAAISHPADYAESMTVLDLLRATPTIGPKKAHRLLLDCRVSPSKTLGGLSRRQRVELVSRIRDRWPHLIATR